MTKARLAACGLGRKQGPDERIKVGALAVTSMVGFWVARGAAAFCGRACKGDSFANTKDGFCVLGIAGKSWAPYSI